MFVPEQDLPSRREGELTQLLQGFSELLLGVYISEN